MYALDLVNVKKSFTLHLQGGLHLPVIAGDVRELRLRDPGSR